MVNLMLLRWTSSLLFVTMRLESNAHFGRDSLLQRTGDFLIHHKYKVPTWKSVAHLTT